MISPYQTFLYHSETRIVFSNRKKENRVGRRRHKLLRGPENSETRKTKEVKEARTTAHMRFGPATSGNQRPIQRQCILNGARTTSYISPRGSGATEEALSSTPPTQVSRCPRHESRMRPTRPRQIPPPRVATPSINTQLSPSPSSIALVVVAQASAAGALGSVRTWGT